MSLHKPLDEVDPEDDSAEQFDGLLDVELEDDLDEDDMGEDDPDDSDYIFGDEPDADD